MVRPNLPADSRGNDVALAPPRRFGRRGAPDGNGLSSAANVAVAARASAERRNTWLLRIGLVSIAIGLAFLLPRMTLGLPGCASSEADGMLREIARGVLAKSKVAYSRMDFTSVGAMPTQASGVHLCRAVLVIDGRESLRLHYEIRWSIRLVFINRHTLKIVSAQPL